MEDLTHKLNSINTGTYLEDATKKKKKKMKRKTCMDRQEAAIGQV